MKVLSVSNINNVSDKSKRSKERTSVSFLGDSRSIASRVIKWGARIGVPFLLTLATVDTFEKYDYEGLEKAGIVDYVEPEQKEFNTRADAVNYAKERVVKALSSDTPYEHAVLINDATNEVFAEFKGDNDKVVTAVSLWDMVKMAYQQTGFSMVHGHPAYQNDVTTPLGFQDFIAFVENEDMREISSVNKYGEISRLRKRPFYQALDSSKVMSLYMEFFNILTNSVKKNAPLVWKNYNNALNNVSDSLKIDSINKEFSKVINKQDSIPEVVRAVQKFWKKHAPKCGMDYYTNYREIREK